MIRFSRTFGLDSRPKCFQLLRVGLESHSAAWCCRYQNRLYNKGCAAAKVQFDVAKKLFS